MAHHTNNWDTLKELFELPTPEPPPSQTQSILPPTQQVSFNNNDATDIVVSPVIIATPPPERQFTTRITTTPTQTEPPLRPKSTDSRRKSLKSNALSALLIAIMVLPYVVLLPTIVILTKQLNEPERQTTPSTPSTPNNSRQLASNVVIYMTPSKAVVESNDTQTVSFKPLSLTLKPTKLNDAIQVEIGQTETSQPPLRFSIATGTNITIQPTTQHPSPQSIILPDRLSQSLSCNGSDCNQPTASQ